MNMAAFTLTRIGSLARTLGLAFALLGLGFAQSASALDPPTITVPASGGTVGDKPTLQWSAVAGATWYLVWLSAGSNGGNILPCAYDAGAVNPKGCWIQGATSLAVTNALPLGPYTLWVQAWSPSSAAWSAATAFTVANRFEDRGLTVYDTQTGLEWEKKTTDDGIHDVENVYSWSTGTNKPDGTAFTTFLAGINAGACTGVSDGTTESKSSDCAFAGHGDWRLPSLAELKTIVNCSFGPPCLDPVFGPSQGGIYWSASSKAGSDTFAWGVDLFGGFNTEFVKTGSTYVRAVRGGN